MDATRWREISAVFERVVELAPDARAAELERACAGDPQLRADVEALLRRDARTPTGALSDVAAQAAAHWAQSAVADDPAGQRIGPWRVLRELGAGGMGVVYLAERADEQYTQQAALKLIRHGFDSDGVRRHFLRERQILARLVHPHIAHLLDGGVSADGQPYFAMEYVDGEPLWRWCLTHGATLDQRLLLFLAICDAVQFAHTQLIVHRDLKPGNVLIDRDGRVKLLDFGIARLLDQDAADGVTVGVGARALTPGYAAPEQWRGETATTATDVYSLGVMLYELLVGRRPFARDGSDARAESERAVGGEAAPLASRAAAANAHAPVSARALRGDLDAILRHALEANPADRYATVEGFADDLRRYRSRMPVRARRGVFGYRLRKFVSRHRLGVGIAAATTLLLAASTLYALHEASIARAQARRAEAVRGLLEDIFRGADPRAAQGHGPSLRELIDAGAARLQGALADQPALAGEFGVILGNVYRNLGVYDRSEQTLRRAIELTGAADPSARAELQRELAQTLIDANKLDAAQGELDLALRAHGFGAGMAGMALARDLAVSGVLAQKRGDYTAAETRLREALAMTRATLAVPNRQEAEQLNLLAVLLHDRHQLADARAATDSALQIFRALYGENQFDVAENLINLGVLDQEGARYADAEKEFDSAAAIYRVLLPPEHPRIAQLLANQARLFDREGRIEEARARYEQALAMQRTLFGADHPDVAGTLNNLGVLERNSGHLQRAAELFTEVAALWQRSAGAEHPLAAISRLNLASVELQLDAAAAAEKNLRAILPVIESKLGDKHPALPRTLDQLGAALRMQGQAIEAIPLQQRALSLRQARGNAPPAEFASGYTQAALTALALHDVAGATQSIDQALAALGEHPDPLQQVEALVAQARIALAAGNRELAATAAHTAAETERARLHGDDWRSAEADLVGAQALHALQRDAEAAPLLQQSRATLAAALPEGHRLRREAESALGAPGKP